jgi:hypothetical protein
MVHPLEVGNDVGMPSVLVAVRAGIGVSLTVIDGVGDTVDPL